MLSPISSELQMEIAAGVVIVGLFLTLWYSDDPERAKEIIINIFAIFCAVVVVVVFVVAVFSLLKFLGGS